MLIHLCITYGCFCTTMAELYSSNRDPPDHKAQHIYYLALYRRNLLTPSLNAAVGKTPKALERTGRPEILTKGESHKKKKNNRPGEKQRQKAGRGKEKQRNNEKSTKEDGTSNQQVMRQRDAGDHPSKLQVWSPSLSPCRIPGTSVCIIASLNF